MFMQDTSWLEWEPREPCPDWPEPDPSPEPEPVPRPEVMRLVSLSGERGRDELLARPEISPALWGLPGPIPVPGGGVLTPEPLK